MVYPPHRASVGYRGSARWEGTRAGFRVVLGPARRLLSARASGGLSPHERPSPIQWPLSAGPFVQEAATSCRTEKGVGGRAGMSPSGEAVVGAGFVRSELAELEEGPAEEGPQTRVPLPSLLPPTLPGHRVTGSEKLRTAVSDGTQISGGGNSTSIAFSAGRIHWNSTRKGTVAWTVSPLVAPSPGPCGDP